MTLRKFAFWFAVVQVAVASLALLTAFTLVPISAFPAAGTLYGNELVGAACSHNPPFAVLTSCQTTTVTIANLARPNTVDATQMAGADMCAKIAAAAVAGYAANPLGVTIDARGFSGTQPCASDPFANWPIVSPVTVASAAASVTVTSGNILTFSAVPAAVAVGQIVVDATHPNAIASGAAVLLATGTQVTIGRMILGSGVQSGDTINFVTTDTGYYQATLRLGSVVIQPSVSIQNIGRVSIIGNDGAQSISTCDTTNPCTGVQSIGTSIQVSATWPGTSCPNWGQLNGASLTGSGAAYAANDILTLVGGTHSVAAEVVVDTVSGGSIATWHIKLGGIYTVEPGSFTVTGGSGSGATFGSPAWVTPPCPVLSIGPNYEPPGGSAGLTPTFGQQIRNVAVSCVPPTGANPANSVGFMDYWGEERTKLDNLDARGCHTGYLIARSAGNGVSFSHLIAEDTGLTAGDTDFECIRIGQFGLSQPTQSEGILDIKYVSCGSTVVAPANYIVIDGNNYSLRHIYTEYDGVGTPGTEIAVCTQQLSQGCGQITLEDVYGNVGGTTNGVYIGKYANAGIFLFSIHGGLNTVNDSQVGVTNYIGATIGCIISSVDYSNVAMYFRSFDFVSVFQPTFTASSSQNGVPGTCISSGPTALASLKLGVAPIPDTHTFLALRSGVNQQMMLKGGTHTQTGGTYDLGMMAECESDINGDEPCEFKGYAAKLSGSGGVGSSFTVNGDGTLAGTGSGVNTSDGPLNVKNGGYQAGGTAGVSCSGAPSGSFASVNGIVTHC